MHCYMVHAVWNIISPASTAFIPSRPQSFVHGIDYIKVHVITFAKQSSIGHFHLVNENPDCHVWVSCMCSFIIGSEPDAIIMVARIIITGVSLGEIFLWRAWPFMLPPACIVLCYQPNPVVLDALMRERSNILRSLPTLPSSSFSSASQ